EFHRSGHLGTIQPGAVGRSQILDVVLVVATEHPGVDLRCVGVIEGDLAPRGPAEGELVGQVETQSGDFRWCDDPELSGDVTTAPTAAFLARFHARDAATDECRPLHL